MTHVMIDGSPYKVTRSTICNKNERSSIYIYVFLDFSRGNLILEREHKEPFVY